MYKITCKVENTFSYRTDKRLSTEQQYAARYNIMIFNNGEISRQAQQQTGKIIIPRACQTRVPHTSVKLGWVMLSEARIRIVGYVGFGWLMLCYVRSGCTSSRRSASLDSES